MKSKPMNRRTELRRASHQGARRLGEAADRRLFLTAKFERTWRGLMRFRVKVGAARLRDLMIDVPDAREKIRSPDQRSVADSSIPCSVARTSAHL
jgi:hypothetical protein